MAVLNRSNIPASINTYERLFFWLAQVLKFLAGNAARNIYYNAEPSQLCSVNLVTGQDGIDYVQVVAFLPYDATELNSKTARTWMSAEDISSASVHANFNSD
jgi:hypothetical protein